jgi:hypothetical protein
MATSAIVFTSLATRTWSAEFRNRATMSFLKRDEGLLPPLLPVCWQRFGAESSLAPSSWTELQPVSSDYGQNVAIHTTNSRVCCSVFADFRCIAVESGVENDSRYTELIEDQEIRR